MNRNVYPFLATALALLSLGLAAAPASASQVQPVSFEACAGISGCSTTSTVRVDEPFGLALDFKVTNTISSGNSIFVELPAGAEFVPPVNVTLGWKNSGYAAPGTTVGNGNRRLQIPIPGFLDGPITSANTLEVNVGFFAHRVIPAAAPGSLNVSVWTSADVDPRASNSITTTLGLPSALVPASASLTATAGGSLSAVPTAKLTDSRGNPLPGEDVTFSVPATGPSGTFAGGGTSSSGETNAQGMVSPAAALSPNSEAGDWKISLFGPNSTTSEIGVTTAPGPADEIELEVSPTSLPADGTSTATATFRVLDGFGNQITGDQVALNTDGGPSSTPPAPQLDGSYVSTLTASTVPGEFTITAEDTSVSPAVTQTATLTQTELPATDLVLSLEPASIPADGSSTTTVVATVENEIGAGVAGETVLFESDGGNEIGATVDHGDGTYSAVVTSTTDPGEVTITATDESALPPLSVSTGLTQTALPPPPLPSDVTPPGQQPQAQAPPTSAKAAIRSGPKGKTRARKARFTFAATGATGFQCRLDKAAWKPCTSPVSFVVGLGAHVFRVRALGPDGQPGPVAKRSFKRLPQKR